MERSSSSSHAPRTESPITSWISLLQTEAGIKENYSQYWGNDPSSLASLSTRISFITGNGTSIYQDRLLPAIESAEQEVILVTCFWARSRSLAALGDSLIRLSEKALSRSNGSKIRVHLCFSSLSWLQLLFHTRSPDGCSYPPSSWFTELGLPSPSKLRGLDLEVKSLFFRPFSIMHPKFLIVDRLEAFMPSCNVSWESWYEDCIELQGPAVTGLLKFWQHHWARRSSDFDPFLTGFSAPSAPFAPEEAVNVRNNVITVLLPSQHHDSLRLSLALPFGSSPAVPLTPLNAFLLDAISKAEDCIDVVTPNLTCTKVIDALLTVLERGVSVKITTNRRMMVLEQLVTAGTITEWCVRKMIRCYLAARERARLLTETNQSRVAEEGRVTNKFGALEICYFRPTGSSFCAGTEAIVKSHIKCTVIDRKLLVLGSGNLDRASWFTSQELGLALYDEALALSVYHRLENELRGQVEKHFVSMSF